MVEKERLSGGELWKSWFERKSKEATVEKCITDSTSFV